ncbi:hypothetical protein PGT21_019989 [Puccinia graminis f. sp. tritici]|uniref:Uncharacterized protein n=1 Tax=Puccinia graminis f. sp. tritici TaxID=56615 RepID=A0A5B0M232_PUCGR|nr:hypothetical protein PGT21_019989 [Puccinia graminis f. sp. tritici]
MPNSTNRSSSHQICNVKTSESDRLNSTEFDPKIDELDLPAVNEDLADRDKSKPAASSRDGFIQSHFASPVSSTKPSNHPTNVNNTTASSGPIGLQADHVYCSQLSPWRFKIWSILLVTLNKEIPILESIQRSYRSGPLDRLMIHSSWLSSHQFFIVALPLIFWLGDHHFGQLQVISLGS